MIACKENAAALARQKDRRGRFTHGDLELNQPSKFL
jgi:hypothetical protein